MEFVRKFRRQVLALFSLPPQQKDSVSRRGGRWGYELRPDSGPFEALQVNVCDKHQVLTYAQALFPDSSDDFM